MATFLDIGLTQHFSVIFTVLLVFVLIFAMLEKSKLFGDNKGLHSLIALCLALMMLFTPGVVQVVAMMAPWFVMMFLFITFFFFLLLAFGVKWESIIAYTSKDWDTPHWFLLVIGIIILVGSIGAVYGGAMLPFSGEDGVSEQATQSVGEDGLSTDTGEFNQNVGRVIFHPKTIGVVFILLVGSFAIRLLAGAKP